ncbi:unnamed protein product [Medioppia subpectinata]|uniref:Uncharacterized protein n=1 Tax=Medioppia subpectinata TaxID=1979941 RepID=A0A7R9PUX8_9ACAR|nr:unnamed protein product [Medioppia subpectinata]CAG2101706.1 unnamed protein product [Medioppia subpectinata]
MSSTPPTGTTSASDTSYQEFVDNRGVDGVGIVSTEGEKLLNALRKIQTKLYQRRPTAGQSVVREVIVNRQSNGHHSMVADSSDRHVCPHRTSCANCSAIDCCNRSAVGSGGGGDDHHYFNGHHRSDLDTRFDDNRGADLMDTRLRLIESQLKTISLQLTAKNGDTSNGKRAVNGDHRPTNSGRPSPTRSGRTTGGRQSPAKRPQVLSASIDDNLDGHGSDDRYEASIDAVRDLFRQTNGTTGRPVPKSRSLDAINPKPSSGGGGRHFHLQLKDIPFLLGTSANSHSVIANRQLEISRLKRHNPLCRHNDHNIPVRKIFDERIRQQVLDTEIKELLFDLQEEHDYICEEIQYLSQQLDQMSGDEGDGDDERRVRFNRDLYFLSRRILAKKRQINELQEMHSTLTRNAPKTSGAVNGATTAATPAAKTRTGQTSGHSKHVMFADNNRVNHKHKQKAVQNGGDDWCPQWK